jgi:hypothetical protein
MVLMQFNVEVANKANDKAELTISTIVSAGLMGVNERLDVFANVDYKSDTIIFPTEVSMEFKRLRDEYNAANTPDNLEELMLAKYSGIFTATSDKNCEYVVINDLEYNVYVVFKRVSAVLNERTYTYYQALPIASGDECHAMLNGTTLTIQTHSNQELIIEELSKVYGNIGFTCNEGCAVIAVYNEENDAYVLFRDVWSNGKYYMVNVVFGSSALAGNECFATVVDKTMIIDQHSSHINSEE